MSNDLEEYGLTPEEYEQAMQEMAEALPQQWPPSEEDDAAMHIDHLLSNVVHEDGSHGYTAEEWSDLCDGFEEADFLQTEHGSDASLQGYVRRMADFARHEGYDPGRDGSVHDWADGVGRRIAEQEGVDWDRLREPFQADGMFADMTDDAPTSFETARFDEMLDWRVAHGEPWTKGDADAMNRRLIEERDGIEQQAYEEAARSEYMHIVADGMEDKRERDGIRGDEPDIPWYEARDHGYGKSVDDMHAEAEAVGEDAGRQYETSMHDLYKRVFDYDMRDFSDVPEATRGDMRIDDFKLRRSTYKELGEDYDRFYQEQLREYTNEHLSMVEAKDVTPEHGVDFSLDVQPQAVVPEMERSQERQVAADKQPKPDKSSSRYAHIKHLSDDLQSKSREQADKSKGDGDLGGND